MKRMNARLRFLPTLFLALSIPVFLIAPLAARAATPGMDAQTPPLLEFYPYLSVLATNNQRLLLEFIPPEPEFEKAEVDGQTCLTSKMAGLTGSADASAPALPAQGALIGIPLDAKPSIRVHHVDREEFQLAHKLCPTATTSLDLANSSPAQVKIEYSWGEIYQQNTFFPATPVELTETGFLRSQRFAQIRLNPLQYLPTQNILNFNKKIIVEIFFNSTEIHLHTLQAAHPMETSIEENLSNILLNHDQARNWRQVNTTTLPLAANQSDDQPFYKILLEQDGIYRITYDELQTAGAPVDSIDPATFQLFNQGKEISIQVSGQDDGNFDPEDEVVFFGQELQSKYSRVNVYWLTWGEEPGLRMQSIDAATTGLANIPTSFFATHHAEMDLLYSTSHFIGKEKDHWFWKMAYATSSTAVVEFQTELLNISPENQDVVIRGELKGYSADPRHHALIYINDSLIGDYTFSSGADFGFEVVAPSSLLVEGVNTLKMECLVDDPITVNGIFLNWFEIDLLKPFMAENDQIDFTYDQTGAWEFRLDGFSSPALEAYDLTDSNNPTIIQNFGIDTTANGQQLSFETTISPRQHETTTPYRQRFLVQASSKRLSPSAIIQDAPSHWKSSQPGADYILITHKDFSVPAQQLADFHANRGMRVQLVDVQDIYDEFNHGLLSPEAIHTFLKYAYANWQPPAPLYVLLMGDGHYDFRNNLGTSGPNYIPPYLDHVDPIVGETAADNRYASVNGDDILPDMYIGRFPVRTPQEAAAMVAKTITYIQQEPIEDWNTNLLFVADDPDAAGNFPVIADQIVNSFISPPYSAEKIYYKEENYPDAASVRNGIVEAINTGKLIVHYNGHGAIPFWASPALFRLEELPRLTNQEKLPLMLPMTCSEGYFIKPYSPSRDSSSLGESIVRMSGGGAIASWSATGYGKTSGHMLLDQSLFTDIFYSNKTMLGYLTTHAKYNLYAQTSLFNDMIETYTLFGDPALSLKTLPSENSRVIYLPLMYQ